MDVVTLGETMALFLPRYPGSLGEVRDLYLSLAGAESNVAIGLCRLGYRSGWIGRLGQDQFGRFILKSLRAEGVDTQFVRMDPHAQTGILCREYRTDRDPRVFYYRAGSAGSRLGPADVPAEYIAASRLLHVTGITAALSPTCHDALLRAVQVARQAGVPVALDPNLRLKLWSASEAAAALRPIIAQSTFVLVGLAEGERLSGRRGEEAVAAWFLEAGCQVAVVKLGSHGSMATDGRQIWRHPGYTVLALDTVGAGDAFAVGFYAAWLAGRDMDTCLRYGNAAGALAVQVMGDVEGLPYREDLEAFLGEGEVVSR